MHATVIGDVEPRGICGSGLVDAVAAGLASGAILPSGRIADGTSSFRSRPRVVLYQADIRELQLAKAAIASGFRLLLKRLGASAGNLQSIYLAGAFGNYVQAESAIGIGLLSTRPSSAFTPRATPRCAAPRFCCYPPASPPCPPSNT